MRDALKITPEQREAPSHSNGPVPVEVEPTRRVYFLIDESPIGLLRRQQDLDAIREGIADMEAGRVAPLDAVIAGIRANFGLPQV